MGYFVANDKMFSTDAACAYVVVYKAVQSGLFSLDAA